MRQTFLLALPVLLALACKPSVSATVEQPEPSPDAQIHVSPEGESEGVVSLDCDGTNAAIIVREGGKYEAIPMAAFEVIYALKVRKYADQGEQLEGSLALRYHQSISERLIYHRALEIECQLAGVDYDKAALAKREAASRQGTNDYPALLRSRGESEESQREVYIAQLRELRLLAHEGKLEVTAEQVAAEYERLRPDTVDDRARIRASHIYVDGLKIGDEAALRARAEELYARAIGGEDFAELARAESDEDTARKGGDLGFLTAPEQPDAFDKAVFKLAPGEISKPLRYGPGYHIIVVLGRYPPGELPFEALEHDIIEDLTERVTSKGLLELKRRLVEAYVVENCIDDLAAKRGLVEDEDENEYE
jgi:parvulin-like peptidyl-prolyl isomerase